MKKRNLDLGWQFRLGETSPWNQPPDPEWRTVDLPHDWSIELPRGPKEPSTNSNGYFPMGIGSYRKRIVLP